MITRWYNGVYSTAQGDKTLKKKGRNPLCPGSHTFFNFTTRLPGVLLLFLFQFRGTLQIMAF